LASEAGVPLEISELTASTAAGAMGCPVAGEMTASPVAKVACTLRTAPAEIPFVTSLTGSTNLARSTSISWAPVERAIPRSAAVRIAANRRREFLRIMRALL
jgi:hypothetical protein